MPAPKIIVVENTPAVGRVGADIVAQAIAARPDASIAAATGHSPMGLYAELATRRRKGELDTKAIRAFQLDEYLGLGQDDPRSLLRWLHQSFLAPLGVNADRVEPLPVDGALDQGCAAFDQALVAQGGLDLAILGLGPNGHIGFNEPPSERDAPTRAVDLTAGTREANTRYWGDLDAVPTRAVTMGMAQLLSARNIVLVVSGKTKRQIVHRALEGPVDAGLPASFLQVADGDVTVVVDRAAWGDGR